MAINYNVYSGKGRPKKTDYTGVEGVDEFNRKLKMIIDNSLSNIERALITGGATIATRASQIVTEKDHVQTGHLRDSVTSFVTVDPKEAFASIGTFPPGGKGFMGVDVPYAPYVEALPDGGFLRPAYNENRVEVQKWIDDAIEKTIKLAESEISSL